MVSNVDRTKNKAGLILKYADILVSLNTEKKRLPFYITNLEKDWIILEMTWFKALNLEINWKEGKLSGPLSLQTTNAIQIDQITTATNWAIKAQKDTRTELPKQY